MSKENRETILSEVKKIICNDRNEQYGEPEDSFEKIADYWTTYLKHNCVAPDADCCLCARDVAILMVLFKLGRMETSCFHATELYRRYRLYDLRNGYHHTCIRGHKPRFGSPAFLKRGAYERTANDRTDAKTIPRLSVRTRKMQISRKSAFQSTSLFKC